MLTYPKKGGCKISYFNDSGQIFTVLQFVALDVGGHPVV
jgi:hypothetical protein